MKLLIGGAASMSDVPGLDAFPPRVDIHFAPDGDALRDALGGTEILLGWELRGLDLETHWARADNLRWIHLCRAGVDSLLFPALVYSDVEVTNARGIFDRAMAETVLGYLLAEAKGFRASWDMQKGHVWESRRSDCLENQCALVVGVGSIGHAVGALLGAAGLRVQGIGRSARDHDPVFGRIHGFGELKALAGNADWVIGVLPSTAETRGIFDRGFFSAMKPGARFVNIGRGDAQDEEALREALETGALAGAMLDVFRTEPLPVDSPLWDTPNLFVSPHISGDYHAFEEDLARQFIDQLERYFNGQPLQNRVDKSIGYTVRP